MPKVTIGFEFGAVVGVVEPDAERSLDADALSEAANVPLRASRPTRPAVAAWRITPTRYNPRFNTPFLELPVLTNDSLVMTRTNPISELTTYKTG
jgi:hypothetical protein